jgi:hypothetical protein
MIPDKTLINLKILSKIPKNGRICRSYNGLISLEVDSMTQSLKRFVRNDSRQQSILEINSIIDESVEILYSLLRSKYMNEQFLETDEYRQHVENLEILLSEMISAKAGIDNLRFTYENDQTAISKLDIILLKLTSSINDSKRKVEYYRRMMYNLKGVTIEN